MYEDGWSRFMRTGQVRDYLAYKEHPDIESANRKAGDIREFGYAGVRNSNRDNHKIGANRGI